MTTLITGGCGLIGSLVCRELVSHGQRPVLFDVAIKTELLSDMLDRVTFVRGDLLDLPDLLRTIQDHHVDLVIHTANLLTPEGHGRTYAAIRVNMLGTAHVYEAARLAPIRKTIFVSTGKTSHVGRMYADSALSGELQVPADPYSSTKVANELLANDYRKLYGLDIRIVRPGGQVYGPGSSFAGYIGPGLLDVVQKSLRGEPVQLDWGKIGGQNVPDDKPSPPVILQYARDAAHGIALVATDQRSKTTVFDFNPGRTVPLEEIADAIRELIPGAQIQTPRLQQSGAEVQLDPRARDELGFQPSYDVKRGMAEFVSFLQTGKLLYA